MDKPTSSLENGDNPDLLAEDFPPHPWDSKTIGVLLLVHLGALAAPFFFSWSAVLAALFLYTVTAMGITLGYHRLLTHRSYKAPKWLCYLIVTCAAISAQAGPAMWVAIHRQHHANSDQEDDPHDASRGFWWCHLGWILKLRPRNLDDEFMQRRAPDVLGEPYYKFLNKHFFGLSVIILLALYQIGGLPWLFWAGFFRIAAVFHGTWLVNSAAHRYGYRSYSTQDLSTNCWWVALLTFGEGWHNNHHAFPHSARHGLKWWELDLSWIFLRFLQKLGLVEQLKTPTEKQAERFSLE